MGAVLGLLFGVGLLLIWSSLLARRQPRPTGAHVAAPPAARRAPGSAR